MMEPAPPRQKLAAIEAVREAVGIDMSLMVDFNQGLQLGEALKRCHAIDDLGLPGSRSPLSTTTLTAMRD
jgi:mandelate racemase